jgi:hypothetical protein
MAPVHIADHQESEAGDHAKDAARRTVEESRETRSIEGFFGLAHAKPPLGRDTRMKIRIFRPRTGVKNSKWRRASQEADELDFF